MPRRRALTEAQLENLFSLPVTETDLIRHWMLNAADLVVIERRRGSHNQLGYALQLCAFRYPGNQALPCSTPDRLPAPLARGTPKA